MTTTEGTLDVNTNQDEGDTLTEEELLGETEENGTSIPGIGEIKVEFVDDPGEVKDVDDVEPGELPTLNEGNNDVGDMNVLEAILGDGDDTKDEFDKEIDANLTSAAKKAAASTKGKKTVKRKSTRKPKTTTKKTTTATTAPPKEKTPPKVSEAIKKTDTESKPAPEKEETPQKIVTATSEGEISATKKLKGKTNDKSKEKVSVTNKTEAEEKEATAATSVTQAVVKKTPVKGAKKKKVTKSATKKEVKKEEPTADVVMADEKPKENSEQNEENMEKKVKELEKLVKAPTSTKTDSVVKLEVEGKQKVKKERTKGQGERKRKTNEPNSSGKEVKSKKGKVKTEVSNESGATTADEEKSAVDASVTLENPEDTMRVVDGYSDNDSHFSEGGSSFTRSYSRSLSRSFSDGSFSVTLSSFTGSHSSLDSIDKELGEEKKKKKRRKGTDEGKSMEHKEFIDNMLKGARYFIIKSNNYENVTLSKAKGVWATPPANERKLNDAYKHSTNVILVFSVKESGRFQGFARLASESRHDGIPVPWVLPPGFDRRILGGTFKVDWLNRKEVTFSKCANLRNPWNENKEVKICRDGQELEPSVGEVLCRMFEDDLTVDIKRINRHSKQHKSSGDGRGDRHRGGFRGEWRGRGGFRGRGGGGDRGGRFNRRGGGGGGFRRRGGQFRDDRGSQRRSDRGANDRRLNDHDFRRDRSRSPPEFYRRNSYDRDSRDRRHKDRVKEFLKDDRSKYGIREETLLHGSYSDYVREFHRQKEMGGSHRSSSSAYYGSSSHHYPSSSARHSYDQNAASAEEFLRRTRR